MPGIYMRFPGGLPKALTLSYDDGVEDDIRLIELMKKHGLKGTFNINSGMYPPEGHVWPDDYLFRRMPKSVAIPLYKESGMEVAVHTVNHPAIVDEPANICLREIMDDRRNLERDYDCIVRGMAYPFGSVSDEVVNAMKASGIVYGRKTGPTGGFGLPHDWYYWHPTCHHNHPQLMEFAQQFVEKTTRHSALLFYLWGHTYEFRRDNNWERIEKFAEFVAGKPDIWYATNIEIYDYMQAYNRLQFSMDGNRVHNPSAVEVFFEIAEKPYSVKSGETITIE